jgi:hypothetical protein
VLQAIWLLCQRVHPPLHQARTGRHFLAGHLDRGPLAAGALDLPATLSAGVLRLGPAQIGTGSSATQGSLSLDLRSGRIDGRAQLQAEAPAGWAGTAETSRASLTANPQCAAGP